MTKKLNTSPDWWKRQLKSQRPNDGKAFSAN
jgi:hypothetical protein